MNKASIKACWFKIKIEVTFSTHQIEKRSIILGFDSNEKNDQQRRVIDELYRWIIKSTKDTKVVILTQKKKEKKYKVFYQLKKYLNQSTQHNNQPDNQKKYSNQQNRSS